MGKSCVEVFSAPTIGIISTGTELVDVDFKPRPTQIRNSNGYSLAAEAGRLKVDVELLGIVKRRIQKRRFRHYAPMGMQKDILILSVVSPWVNMTSWVTVMKDLNTQIYFEKVALRFRQTRFRKKDQDLYLCLAGNPVASFVTFEFSFTLPYGK